MWSALRLFPPACSPKTISVARVYGNNFATMRELLKPGDLAPEDGIYCVHHYQHRLPHKVSIVKESKLPPCKKCGDRVRFELMIDNKEGRQLKRDRDFSGK